MAPLYIYISNVVLILGQGKLVGQNTYHVEDAPLYEDAFLEDDEDDKATEETQDSLASK
jgi:hypothetical protein